MATNGSFYSSSANVSGGYPNQLKFIWQLKEQNIDNNTSIISYQVEGAGGNSSNKYTYCKQKYCIVDGYKQENTTLQAIYNGTVIFSGEKTIYHNADGSKNFEANIGGAFHTYSDYNATGSAIFSLPVIPRKSSVTATNGEIVGLNPVFTINKASPNFTHTLWYKFGELIGTIINKTQYSVYNGWEIPVTFYAEMPNEKTKECKVFCDTYNGENYIGTQECSFIVSVIESYNTPNITGDIYDSNTSSVALTNDNKKFIKYISNATFSLTATPANSATIKNQGCKNGNMYNNNSSGTINNVESADFLCYTTDSRGLSASITYSYTLIPYIRLSHTSSVEMAKTDGTAKINVNGYYWSGNFGAVNNSLILQYRIKEKNGEYSDWVNCSATINAESNKYSQTINISGLDYTKTYIVQTRANDKIMLIESEEQTIVCIPVFDWGKDDFNINGTLKINTAPVTDFVIAQGVSSGWIYRKWFSGFYECWKTIETTISSSGAAANTYVSATSNLPITFTSRNYAQITNGYNGWRVNSPYENQYNDGSDNKKIRIVSWLNTEASANSLQSWSVYINGYWK